MNIFSNTFKLLLVNIYKTRGDPLVMTSVSRYKMTIAWEAILLFTFRGHPRLCLVAHLWNPLLSLVHLKLHRSLQFSIQLGCPMLTVLLAVMQPSSLPCWTGSTGRPPWHQVFEKVSTMRLSRPMCRFWPFILRDLHSPVLLQDVRMLVWAD